MSEMFMAATNGFSGGYARTESGLYCTAIAGNGTGMERDYEFVSARHAADLEDAEMIGRTAAEKAVKRLKAADAILFDDLASGPILAHASPEAEVAINRLKTTLQTTTPTSNTSTAWNSSCKVATLLTA